ncbi:MAG TPA: HNH endonuclease [Kineosporiaceae bacterium]|nr:HNH endonuclease [Kineosporiaceae bacterium]
MLKRADNVSLFHAPTGVLSRQSRLFLVIGKKRFGAGKKSKDEVAALHQAATRRPVAFGPVGGRTYWLFEGLFYSDNEGLNHGQVHALLVTRQQRRQQQIDRAEAMLVMDAAQKPPAKRRDVIPDDVKQFVFKRDGGRCCRCQSQTELQFDHIIPVALGGGSAVENLQVLCGPCNRRKGAGLTTR